MSSEGDSAPITPLHPTLLEILRCPETKQALTLLDPSSLEILNRKIAAGELRNKGGNPIEDPLDGGLIRSDRNVTYPIRDTIPIMLIEEGIPVDGIL